MEATKKVVYLLTTGNDADGNGWRVISIHGSPTGAYKALLRRWKTVEKIVSGYDPETDPNIEEWEVEE